MMAASQGWTDVVEAIANTGAEMYAIVKVCLLFYVKYVEMHKFLRL